MRCPKHPGHCQYHFPVSVVQRMDPKGQCISCHQFQRGFQQHWRKHLVRLKFRIGNGVWVGDHEVDVGIPISIVDHPDSQIGVISGVLIQCDGVCIDGVIRPVVKEAIVP